MATVSISMFFVYFSDFSLKFTMFVFRSIMCLERLLTEDAMFRETQSSDKFSLLCPWCDYPEMRDYFILKPGINLAPLSALHPQGKIKSSTSTALAVVAESQTVLARQEGVAGGRLAANPSTGCGPQSFEHPLGLQCRRTTVLQFITEVSAETGLAAR
jgi:hypothetical protein